MKKISQFNAYIMASRAMLNGDQKMEKKIISLLIKATQRDKEEGVYSRYIELNENEEKGITRRLLEVIQK